MIVPLAAFTPQSPGARATFDLGIISTIIFTLIFVAVAGTVFYRRSCRHGIFPKGEQP